MSLEKVSSILLIVSGVFEIDGLIVDDECLNDGFGDSFFAHIIREPDGAILKYKIKLNLLPRTFLNNQKLFSNSVRLS